MNFAYPTTGTVADLNRLRRRQERLADVAAQLARLGYHVEAAEVDRDREILAGLQFTATDHHCVFCEQDFAVTWTVGEIGPVSTGHVSRTGLCGACSVRLEREAEPTRAATYEQLAAAGLGVDDARVQQVGPFRPDRNPGEKER